MKIKLSIIALLLLVLPSLFFGTVKVNVVKALNANETNIVVYDENNKYLFERSDVVVGDNYISKDFKMYDVTSVDVNSNTATAKFIKLLKKPNVNISKNPTQVTGIQKNVGIYMTHNAESYVPSDGYDSIYGAGGIHDVSKKLKQSLMNRGFNVVLDETLHIPHNSTAYNRSSITAKRLLSQNNLNVLLDIHRDGVSRQYYVENVNGREKCKIRLVVGQANPKKAVTLEFALALMAVGQELYPWLFADIYYAANHYNQALFEKSMLLEMGTYLVEKELVLESIAPLAEVIDTTLFGSTIDSNGDITVGGTPDSENPNINDHLTNKANSLDKWNTVAIIFSVIGCAAFGVVMYFMISSFIKQKKRK